MALVHLTKATCHNLTEGFPTSGELSSYWPSVALLLAHRRQRWPKRKPALMFMLFDVFFYHRCRCEIPLLKDGVLNRGCFRVIINRKRGLLISSTEHNSIRETKLRGKSMHALPL